VIVKLLRRLAGFTLGNIAYVLASLVPRDDKLWLFAAWNGRRYLDNPKYIFEFVTRNYPDVQAVWICKDRALYLAMAAAGRTAAYAYSWRGIVYQLRASLVVFTHSVSWDFVAFLVGGGVKRVQTWHGIPLKKIGYDDMRNGDPRSKARLLGRLFWYEDDRCDVVLAASETDAAKYLTALNVVPSGIRITGYPRNDPIARSATRHARTLRDRAKIIYMPTFRGGVGSEFRVFEESRFDFGAADRLCSELGVELHIKLHPVQVFSTRDRELIESSSYLHAVGNVDDIYERLSEFEVLITDFSGIFFDFLITGRPIVMAPIGFEKYVTNDRELYYRYEDICPDEPCRTWDEVFARLRDLVRSNFVPGERYHALQARFHHHLDDRSAERAAAELRRLAS
jgi:CDP-glycerol glycerophosphotransferase (TagB/SpsB family)